MARYEICVGGHLGEMIRAAFADLRIQVRGGDTVLSGVMADQAALFGVLRQVEALGLELIEVRRVPLCGPDGLKESLSHVVRVGQQSLVRAGDDDWRNADPGGSFGAHRVGHRFPGPGDKRAVEGDPRKSPSNPAHGPGDRDGDDRVP